MTLDPAQISRCRRFKIDHATAYVDRRGVVVATEATVPEWHGRPWGEIECEARRTGKKVEEVT